MKAGRGIVETFVRTGGTPRRVRCELATPREIRALAKWQIPRARTGAMLDAVEYAGLTCKRWGFYLQEGRAITDAGQLHDPALIAEDELAFLVVARAAWARPSVLGLCLFRRSWCNHLVVDFLAVHPRFQHGGSRPVKGVGAALLLAVTEIAGQLGVPKIWGEATRGSAAKYENFFDLPRVSDLFIVRRAALRKFTTDFLARYPETRLLLRAPMPSSGP